MKGFRVFAGLTACLLLASCEKPTWMDPGLAKGPPAGPFSPSGSPDLRKPNANSKAVQISPQGAPQPPIWAIEVIGKSLATVFPSRVDCIGNTDLVVLKYAGKPPGLKVLGWGWDPASRRIIERFILVDSQLQIVGFGEGGVRRPDVIAARLDIEDERVGWYGYIPVDAGTVQVFGVVGRSVCPLGSLSL